LHALDGLAVDGETWRVSQSSVTLSASDRLDGEFADWFDAGPLLATGHR
jgi:hypothetical protein